MMDMGLVQLRDIDAPYITDDKMSAEDKKQYESAISTA